MTSEQTIEAGARSAHEVDTAIAAGATGAGSGAEEASLATVPPRGTDPSLPPDADPEPLPIGIADMWRLGQKTYRAERRYYLKLERHRPVTARRLSI